MGIEKNQKLFNALEMLELLLPAKIAIELNQLFDFVLDPFTKKSLYSERQIKILFNKVIFNDSYSFNPWTRAVCVYYSWKQNETELLSKLRNNNYSKDPYIIKETKEFVLNAIK